LVFSGWQVYEQLLSAWLAQFNGNRLNSLA
jgi:hypothetical protein